MDRREAAQTALGLIAAHNIAQNTVLNRRGYVVGNLLVAGTLAALGKAAGLGFTDMGLSLELKRSDLQAAGVVTAVTLAGSSIALAHPKSRAMLRDERAHDSSSQIAHKTLVRFPIGTALFEEATFRGVLPALAGRSSAAGDFVSAGFFGLWHVIPTARALPGSPLSQDMNLAGRGKAIVAGCGATALAGLGFSFLRRRSGSIVLPWLIHTVFNTITYLAGVLAWRIGDRST